MLFIRATNENNCRSSAYEALSTVSTFSANDTLPAISKLLLVILERAEQLLSMQNQIVGTDDRNNYNELHMNFCGLLTVGLTDMMCSSPVNNVTDEISVILAGHNSPTWQRNQASQ